MKRDCWGLKSLPESGQKVAGKHHNRAGRGAAAVGREKEERKLERESVL